MLKLNAVYALVDAFSAMHFDKVDSSITDAVKCVALTLLYFSIHHLLNYIC